MAHSTSPMYQNETATRRSIVQDMLKERESYARNQKYDYSHVFRKKTTFEMLRLAAIGMAIELAYAAETSFASPILLQNGVSHEFMSMVWGFSPLIGFFVSPLLGSISDRCSLSLGRRRPIIICLALGIICGLFLVPYGRNIGLLLSPKIGENVNVTLTNATIPVIPESQGFSLNIGAIITVIGIATLDLCADISQTPSRTYMLDMCTPDEQSRGLTMFSILAGIGGTFGYALGGIDWNNFAIGTFLGGNSHTVFMIVLMIFVVCVLITITTFREIPLRLIDNDVMLKPVSYAAVSNEIRLQDQQQQQQKPSKEENEDYNALNTNNKEEMEPNLTIGQYIKSIFLMPRSMRILAFTNLIIWMAHVTYCLYFTDFVGEAVFLGDPKASDDTELGRNYNVGVRFGCFGLSIYALSCSIYSLSINKLIKLFGQKCVFIASILYHALGMLTLALWPTKWGVLVFSTSAGILYGTLFTIPYMLVANYHAKDCFRIRQGETVPLKHVRGLGTDVAIISSMVFVAQFIVSISCGYLVEFFNTTRTIIYLSSIFGFIGAFSACFVFYI